MCAEAVFAETVCMCRGCIEETTGDTGELGSIPELGRFPWEEEMTTHSSILAWKI